MAYICASCGAPGIFHAGCSCPACASTLCDSCWTHDVKVKGMKNGCGVCRCERVTDGFLLRTLLQVIGMSRETAMKLVAGHLLNRK